jgi:tRNA dimethylallyltransferase
MQQKTAIIIAGPTAVGKTALSVRLAQVLGTEIISADSRQCFRELDIGVAKPDQAEQAAVPHHFIDSHSIFDEMNAAIFERYALGKANEIFSRKNHLIVSGGTGLYLRAFMEGFDPMPEVPRTFRDEVDALYATGGIPALRDALVKEDPRFASEGEMLNPQRMMRALAFRRATGGSIRDHQKKARQIRPFRILRIGLELPREELYARVNDRVDLMMSRGLLEEVRQLMPYRHLNALQTVGYRDLFDHFDGNCTVGQAIESVRQHTRHFAKRQLTWFRADPDMKWFGPSDDQGILSYLRDSS